LTGYFVNPPKHIISICEDRNGFLWLGTPNGLVIFDPRTENFSEYNHEQNNPNSISGNYLPSVYKDKSGTMWLGTGGGITYYNPNKTKFDRFFNEGAVWTINTDSFNNLYIGTTKNGLWVLDSNRANQRRILYNDKPASTRAHNFAVSINSDIADNLLIGFERDFYKYNIINRTSTKYPAKEGRFRIWDILIDSRGLIWLAPMTEIVILDKEMKEMASVTHTDDQSSLSEGYVTVLLESKSGVIWAGTSSGLNKIEIKNLAKESDPEFNITRYKNISNDSNSISGNNITCLYEDNNGTLWVGTQNGLNKLIQNFEKFNRYTETEGLPENSVQGILEDDSGNLWISTDKFLTKFNPYSETFTNYSTSDGLPNKFLTKSCHKSKKGEMFFGTENGVIAFYPEYIKENPHVPPLVITSFKVFNKQAVIPKSIWKYISHIKKIFSLLSFQH
jgi:ligand-binding sensor domain-containing protein